MITLRLLNYQRKTLSETFQNTGIGENFLKRSPVAQEVASRIEKMELYEILNPLHNKVVITRVKRWPMG